MMLFIILLFAYSAFASIESDFEFYKFTHYYNKNYSNLIEFEKRKNVFEKNYNFIKSHNEKKHSYTLDINEYADLLIEEYHPNKRLADYALKRNSQHKPLYYHDEIKKNIDWRSVGAVTSIKNQQSCGSCWAFSTTGSVEGAWFLKTGKLISLSEQQLMDCSYPQGDQSCEGGLMDYAFSYIISNGGICAENNYPYVAKDESCKTCDKVANISKYIDVASNNKTALLEALQYGPVSVAIEADQSSFQLYSSGIYDDPNCGTSLDHGVLLVGAGQENNKNYWIIKNSWGANWGENGYIRLAMDTNNPEGQCGILMKASYPVV